MRLQAACVCVCVCIDALIVCFCKYLQELFTYKLFMNILVESYFLLLNFGIFRVTFEFLVPGPYIYIWQITNEYSNCRDKIGAGSFFLGE